MLHIDISVPNSGWSQISGDLEAYVTRALEAAWSRVAADRNDAEICVVLGDDELVRDLNARYRNQDKPTNVLSFPADMPVSDGPTLLGDVVLARETLEREAMAAGKSASDHLAHLVVHGLLHLLEYDHEDDADADIMEGLEIDILKLLDIADPYADNDGQQVQV